MFPSIDIFLFLFSKLLLYVGLEHILFGGVAMAKTNETSFKYN